MLYYDKSKLTDYYIQGDIFYLAILIVWNLILPVFLSPVWGGLIVFPPAHYTKVSKLASIIYERTKWKPYFHKAKLFKQKEEEDDKYIGELTNQYPGIEKFNYNKKKYFLNIMDSILSWEKNFVIKANKEQNKRRIIEYWTSLDGFSFEKKLANFIKN